MQTNRRTAAAVVLMAAFALLGLAAWTLDALPWSESPAVLTASGNADCPTGEPGAGQEPITCTHGPDPAPPGYNIKRSVLPEPAKVTDRILSRAGSTPAWCEGDGVTGKRVQVLYVREQNQASRYSQYLASFRTWTIEMDTVFSRNARWSGGDRHIRLVTEGNCVISIPEIVVPNGSLDSWGTFESALRSLGYNRTDRKYAVWVDDTIYCGVGSFSNDDRKISSNWNNTGPSYARVDSGCWSTWAMAHELGHNLGAVNYSAPNSTGSAHCIDEYDIMCYSDAPSYPKMVYTCSDRSIRETMFDCNHDDYYSANPAPGSYLANNFNVADNQFLIKPASNGTTPPEPTITPFPTPGAPPAHDLVENAVAFTGPFPAVHTSHMNTATSSSSDPTISCAGMTGERTLWYSLRLGYSATVTLSPAGSTYDAILGVFSGTNGRGPEVACGYWGSDLTFEAAANTTYWIDLAAWQDSVGSAVLSVAVKRDTTPPDVRITAPKAKARLSSLGSVTVSASDLGGPVAKVELFMCKTARCSPTTGGRLVGTDTTAPYSFRIAPAVRSGIARIAARATDASGNMMVSPIIQVTVGGTRAGQASTCGEDVTARSAADDADSGSNGRRDGGKRDSADKREHDRVDRAKDRKPGQTGGIGCDDSSPGAELPR